MYKNLIRKVAEEKAIEFKQQQKELANQKRIQKEKYNISNLFIGYTSRVITTYDRGRRYLKQLTDATPKIFRHTALDTFQDIETEKLYPILREGKIAKENEICIMEDNLQHYEVACIDILDKDEIKPNTRLSRAQLREILDKQTKLEERRF